MMARLKWADLLSTKRERTSSRTVGEMYVARNEFEADYDRIVGSSSVRRLQDKAQVFPLQEDDVARTRLTHSIEVSAMARSMGKAAGKELAKIDSEFSANADYIDQLAALLQVAGLIHDLGNPPFGHYGETIIQQWFDEWFRSTRILSTHPPVLSEQERNDFLHFDGNVQNIRILSKLQTQNDTYGANFTYATLATIMKYPWASNQKKVETKKFGYFKSEEDLAKDIRKTLGLGDMVRHPATYLLEAADDIIYLCDDIEDGAKKGYIDWPSEYKKIKSNISETSDKLGELFERIDKKPIDRRMDSREQITAQIRNFRNMVQSYLFKRCIGEFVGNYDKFMENKPMGDYELLKCERVLIQELKRVTRANCFTCHEVLALELEGDRVISTLLDIFVNAVIGHSGEELLDTRLYCGKIFALISPNFVYRTLYDHAEDSVIEKELEQQAADLHKYTIQKLDELSQYGRLHLVTDFVSGMTDSYAVQVYQELCGIRHP